MFGLLGLLGPAQAMPHYGQVKQAYRSSDWVLLDRHGEQLQVLRQDFSRRAGAWVPLEQISPALLQAVLASEDKRYYDHGGVDWLALAGAGWDSAVGSQLRGASTISMQLAGMLQEGLQRAAGGRTVMQKWQQIQAARQLEGSWSKQQILEAYLNLVSFRGEIQGVDALSRVLFQKQAVALTVRESALAAALLRGPNAPQAVLRRRTCALLLEVARGEQCQGLADFLSVTLARHAQPAYGHAQLAPHFARLVQQQLPASVRTEDTEQVSSLDAALQNHVKQSIRQQLLALNQAYVQDAAAVVLAVETGEILAYVGSSSDLSQASQVDHAVALRQAGSTLKPFLYAQALDQRRISAASLLHDAPLNLPTGNGLYVPQNYDKSFTGWVSARTALASSLNIPAVRVLTLLGAQSMVDNLLALGLPLKQSGQFYGYSLALGSADVDLLSLTNAYRALAQGGQASDWHWQRGGVTLSPSTSRSVYSPQAAWLIGDILSDRQARVHTFGLDSVLSTPFWSAVKTGTSKDMRDNWAIGWSEHYVVGVWVGNSSGASMQDVSGVSGAAPIWHDIMRYLHAQLPSRATAPPEGLHSVDIHYQPALEAARTEYFLTGTEQAEFVLPDSATDAGARPSITRPVAGTILALDPDIPPANQRLLLQAKGDPQQLQGLRWVINGQLWASGAQAWWPPQPGRQTIEIYSAQQQRLDTLTIEVRGAQRKEVRKH
ncbi:penicillin-binding protein 1C [Alcaligenes endophyticus]|uniref:peptidoglycan glycosyltransferase n=1 Tax=Alcaligenes endophyticus TaxID=1929088 RepID=A0ABT8EL53_9BURK|nr:penicillin-binding protein 1C [Alcaligenes endophyticus]MCX5590623.1 penicillin-binding protein 1C [Alcaligenes endophyticus]MDN4122013.1 penicillin-binding protein 1C [Alcaligenes endophyticus]